MNIETQLRDTLHRAADELGAAEPPQAVRVSGMHSLARRRSRRRAAMLSAGLAVLLVAVAVPFGLSLLRTGDDRIAAPLLEGGIFGVPTRGSLAGDAAFVEAVRQLPWVVPGVEPGPGLDGTVEAPNAPVETRRVVFAGDVPQGRWAVVVGQNTTKPSGEDPIPDLQINPGALSDTAVAWYAGPPGATPEQMQLVNEPRGIAADQPASFYNAASGDLVVVAAPGDVIEVSPRPEVSADGTVTRRFENIGAADGVAVTALEPNRSIEVTPAQYRVSRAGVIIVDQALHGGDQDFENSDLPTSPGDSRDEPSEGLPQIELDYVRTPGDLLPGGDPALSWGYLIREQEMAREISAEYGLAPDELGLQVHYVGPLPAIAGGEAGLAVLTATFPSGAVLTRAEWIQRLVLPEQPIGEYFGADECADELSAAGAPAAQRIMVMRCDVIATVALEGPARLPPGISEVPEPVSTLVVIAPPDLAGGYASAQGTSETIRLDLPNDGVGMIAFPEGAQSVVIHSGDGTVVQEVPIFTA